MFGSDHSTFCANCLAVQDTVPLSAMVESRSEQASGSSPIHPSSPTVEPQEFVAKSLASGPRLQGLACANLETRRSLIFFSDACKVGAVAGTPIPLERIRQIELLSQEPAANTPLELPSLWQVRIELHPTQQKTTQLCTVFED